MFTSLSFMKGSKKGVFIAIEGTDGSGKGTQFKLLISSLRRHGLKVETLDFPQYGKKSAHFVEQYLNGAYGKKVSPYIASLFYSLDRYSVKEKLNTWLKQGMVVVANRFTLSNAAHQGGKLKKAKDINKYWQWLFNLEFGVLGLPKPDITILLYVPAQIAQKLVMKKAPRSYIKSGAGKDIHEGDLAHLKAAELRYLKLAKLIKASVIKCVESGRLLTPQEIHRKVLDKINKASLK